MSEPGEGVREEFLAEAQEIVESLSRDLLLLDQGQKENRVEPDLVNEVFRGVHTLKGIAGMFGYHQVGAIAHALEDLLDDLRLGRVDLTPDVLDVLFQGVENFYRLLAETKKSNEPAEVNLEEFAQSIERVSSPQRDPNDPLEHYELDPNVLSVLTEYEEHRLRTNVSKGIPLYRLRVRFELAVIDSSLEDLKQRAKPIAEIITYLPSMGGGIDETIDLDVLFASSASIDELKDTFGDKGVQLLPIEKNEDAPVATPAAPSRVAPDPRSETPVSAMPSAPRYQTSIPPVPIAPSEVHSFSEEPSQLSHVSGNETSLRSVANTVRVDISKLDYLMNVVGELAIVRSSVTKVGERLRGHPEMRQLAMELHRVNRGFERRLEELQAGILDVRMVPLGQVFDKLARIVRQVAREHEKKVKLVVTGSETEVDKLIVEELSDPLMHIIRNAIDHGIESPKVRELSEKPPVGTLALNAFQKGNHVLIEVEDDGAGMNPEALLRSAVAKGVVTEETGEEMSRDEIFGLIFAPGFSTRASITETSGRGVGMDVVKTNIGRLGGIIDVESELGTGTKFTITLPITLAIISALLTRVSERTFAIPLTSVQEAIALDPESIRLVQGREVITLRGATLPLCRLDQLFGLERKERWAKSFVVVSSLGTRRVGFVVDSLEGQQDIVIKSLGQSLADVRGFAGATDLGDQRVALVLDAPGLLEEVLSPVEFSAALEATL
ncbi:MAG: chemotaxis protein CheA [Myxococcota bacterium]